MATRIPRAAGVVSLVALLMIAEQAAIAQRIGNSPLPRRAELARLGLERAWFSQAGMNPVRDVVRHLVADEENLYVLASSNLITVYNNDSGKKLWSRQLGRRDAPSFAPVSNQDLVLIAAGTDLFCLNKFNGKLAWQVKLPAQPSTSPAMDAERVFIGMLDGSVYCFNLRKIRELYAEGLLPQWSYQTVEWRHKAGKQISAPPVPLPIERLAKVKSSDASEQTEVARSVAFASRDKSIYAISAVDHQLLWQLEMDYSASAPLAQQGTSLFMASQDNKLYCVNTGSGAVRWTLETGLAIRQQPWVVGKKVYLAPSRGGLYCVTSISGRELWWRPRLSQFLASTEKFVYAVDRYGNLVKVAAEGGGIKGALPLRAFKVRVHNVRTDRIYLATESGMVMCLKEAGAGLPVYHKYPERKPILPEFAE